MTADLRLALRRLAAAPVAVAVAVLSLALGVGATVAAFSFVEATALRPLPLVRNPERVVRVATAASGQGPGQSAYPAFAAYQGGAPALERLAAYQPYAFGLQTRPGDAALATWGVFASADYFRVLGVAPALGRFPEAADDRPGAPPVVVLSYALWRERFGADPRALGRRVTLNGREATVVGVAPPRFNGAEMVFRADLWVPLGTYPALGDFPTKLEQGYSRWLALVGRLRAGATPAEAGAQLATVSGRLTAAKVIDPDTRPVVRPLDGGEGADLLPSTFAVLLGAGATLLLVVCANVAALLLVRGLARARDAGVRAAVGAGRWRLAREALAESAVIATLGGALGVAIAAWARGALLGLVPDTGVPITLDAPLDARVLAVALGAGTFAALAAGLAPAVRAARVDPAALLAHGGRGVAARPPRLVAALAAAQVAFAAVALVGAALFARTFAELRRVDTGMRDPARALVSWTDFGYVGRRDVAEQRRVVGEALARLRATPGVRAAAAADFVPLGSRGYDTWTTQVDGYTPAPGESMDVPESSVTPGYFAAVGTPIVRGRGFTDADGPDAPRVVVVSEAFARRFWPGGDALGRAVHFGSRTATVVGVARDAAYRDDDLRRPPRAFVYQPYAQAPVAAVGFVVRTAGDPLAAAPALRRAVAAADPALPLTAPLTLAEWASNATLLPGIMAKVLGALGALALALAGAGVFGVVAYSAERRRREVGIRVALGATRGRVAGAFLRDGARLTAVGLVAGGALAALAARLIRGLLYGVSPADPAAFGGAALVLLAAALLASWLPARRAARVDPVEALRAE